MSWKIVVKQKAIYVDETKPKVKLLQIYPSNFEPEIGITFRVSCCSAYEQKKYKIEKVEDKRYDDDGNEIDPIMVEKIVEDGFDLIPDFELESTLVKVEGEEYTKWVGGDLPYLENIILKKTNYEKL